MRDLSGTVPVTSQDSADPLPSSIIKAHNANDIAGPDADLKARIEELAGTPVTTASERATIKAKPEPATAVEIHEQQLDIICRNPNFSAPDGTITDPEAEPKPSTAAAARSARRSVLKIWETGDPQEREQLRDIVIAEYFTSAAGADILLRIPADNRKELRDLLDQLTVDGLCGIMSDDFRRKLENRGSVKRRTINLRASSSTVSGMMPGTGSPRQRIPRQLQRPIKEDSALAQGIHGAGGSMTEHSTTTEGTQR